jgi:hypothetical protein
MARTVVAIFRNFQHANDAVRELVDHGFKRDDISIVAHNSQDAAGYTTTGRTAAEGTVADETGAGAGVGAGIGAAIGGIGGLLVGLGALVIPGIGPVIAAGPLAVALSTLTGAGVGAVAGGVTGGLLGALIGLGVPEEEAEYYAEGVRRGGVLVTVQADDSNAEQITNLLNRHDPLDIDQEVTQWREQGWTGFDDIEGRDSRRTSTLDDTVETETTRRETQIANTGRQQDLTMDSTMHDQSVVDNTEFDPNSPSYQAHYDQTLQDSGYSYEYYMPAYRYGYNLRTDPRFEGLDWVRMEKEVQRDWEDRYPGTWERFKASIRHAWEDITD